MSLTKEDLQAIRDLVREENKAIRESQIKVEHEWLPQIKAAIDENAGSLDKYMEHERRLTVVERVVEDHGVRIFSFEQAV